MRSFNRREFMATGMLAAGAVTLAAKADSGTANVGQGEEWPILPGATVHRVYVGKTGHAWPKPAFDPKAEVAVFEQRIAEMRPQLSGIDLVGGELIQGPEDMAKLTPQLAKADGILIIHLSLGTITELQQIVDLGRPTAVYSQPFSGHEWMFIRQWQKNGKKLALYATSDWKEIIEAIRLVSVPARMAKSRVVAVPGKLDGAPDTCVPEKIKSKFGTEVAAVSYEQLIEAHKAIDPKVAEEEARKYWIEPARKIVEPTPEEIVKSARMYLAMKATMQAERAQGITINCLGGLPIDKLGYPCLAFSKMDDLGLVGACESDIDSTLTKLIFTYAFGVPGFITDPLFDTAKNAVIHAHCTAPTRMDGPAGRRAPFIIRTHTDDDKGASLEVEMRVGQVITCAKLAGLDTMLVTGGKITEITDFDDRGCRTQITTEVADARKLLDNWGAGLLDGWMPQLHRVVFYGDHIQAVRQLGAIMDFKILEAM